MFNYPSTADDSSSALPFQHEIDDIPLPKNISPSQLGILRFDLLQQDEPQGTSIPRCHAECGCEQARLVLPLIVKWIEAVIPQFANIDNGVFGVWDRHVTSILKTANLATGENYGSKLIGGTVQPIWIEEAGRIEYRSTPPLLFLCRATTTSNADTLQTPAPPHTSPTDYP
ncbi:MAG: hypothetical protein KA003_19295 [Caldilineaceae bacterium]|nr:hypothetical protein [Caldilineaceae bacterium]